eukprot:CAMPEP_0118922006 /NCGR_PEP_ID=MMETSP1169-20130426/1093_1 /TAXON_ID=36882 /ORGANISM="Pyramimonas obovata, Strain CCMP722" /LENGTH=276 /DNA_ID=CAMNT_0006862819 /DNA_START=265 /DNA_END=1094 /DNA_ORIENTATION=+
MPPKSSKFRGVTLFRPTGKWRAQISAAGKTTSLGDHDTEEEAARAFDRAAINKAGTNALTNFSTDEYQNELAKLVKMTQAELVAELRNRARKSGRQTSKYRGVSLLKQTKKWHAQINIAGKQLHLGFFGTEELAARAYDRAAIHKAHVEGTSLLMTNFDSSDYDSERDMLHSISLTELVTRLSGSSTVKTDVKTENASESESENQSTENMEMGEEGSPPRFATDIKASAFPIKKRTAPAITSSDGVLSTGEGAADKDAALQSGMLAPIFPSILSPL